jgi:hypothetical protein
MRINRERECQGRLSPATQSFEPRSPDSEDEPTPSQGLKSSSSARSSQESYKPGSSNGSEVDDDEHSDQTKSELITVNLASQRNFRYFRDSCREMAAVHLILAVFSVLFSLDCPRG